MSMGSDEYASANNQHVGAAACADKMFLATAEQTLVSGSWRFLGNSSAFKCKQAEDICRSPLVPGFDGGSAAVQRSIVAGRVLLATEPLISPGITLHLVRASVCTVLTPSCRVVQPRCCRADHGGILA